MKKFMQRAFFALCLLPSVACASEPTKMESPTAQDTQGSTPSDQVAAKPVGTEKHHWHGYSSQHNPNAREPGYMRR